MSEWPFWVKSQEGVSILFRTSNLQNSKTRSIFHEEWWLDAATNSDWHKSEVIREGKTIALMPYYMVRRNRVTRIGMPPYTRVFDPDILLPDSKPVTRQTSVNELIPELMRQIPPHDVFRYCLSPGCELASAFVFGGWQVIHDYTFRVAADVSEATVLENMHWRTRSHIRQSKERLGIEHSLEFDRYMQLAATQVTQTRKLSRHEFGVLKRIFDACERHDCTSVITAHRDDGSVTAAAVLLYDSHVLYFWLGARDAADTGSRGYTLLLWEALQSARRRGLIFDLDGFASSSAARYLIHFGASIVERPIVLSSGLKFRTLAAARDISRRILRRPPINPDSRMV